MLFLFPRQGVLLVGLVYQADGIADMPGIFEEGTCRIKTFSGDFGNGAVEAHLATDLVAGVPSVGFGFGRSVLQTIRCHADIEAAVGAAYFVGPPMGEDLVVGGFLADLPV